MIAGVLPESVHPASARTSAIQNAGKNALRAIQCKLSVSLCCESSKLSRLDWTAVLGPAQVVPHMAMGPSYCIGISTQDFGKLNL